MKLFTLPFTKLFISILFLILSSCQSIDVRGQFVSDNAIEEINVKKLNQSQIVELIGSPTYIPKYSSNDWYYIQRSQTKRAWFDPKVIEQRIIKISFTNDGQFKEASLLSDIHEKNIAMNVNYTKAKGTERSGIQQFMKNIGRFNKTKDEKKKPRRNKPNSL